MATLTDETRETLEAIKRTAQEQGETFKKQITESVKSYNEAAASAREAAMSLYRAGQRMEWRHYLLAIATGMLTALVVSASWLWLAPPRVENTLDPAQVAQLLKPALIEALPPSRSRRTH